MKNLGLGMMRLPVLNGEETNFDYEQLNKMVDTFLEAGGHPFGRHECNISGRRGRGISQEKYILNRKKIRSARQRALLVFCFKGRF